MHTSCKQRLQQEGRRKLQLVSSIDNTIMWCKHAKNKKRKRKIGKERGLNSLPFHHLLEWCQVGCCDSSLGGAVFCRSPCVRCQGVYVEDLKCCRGRVYRSLPTSVGVISWSPESCRLCLIVQVPKPCPSGRRSRLSCLQACMDGLPLQWSLIPPRSYFLWDIAVLRYAILIDEQAHG